MKEHRMGKDEHLWIHSMGKRFRVRGIFTDDDSANRYMATHTDTGCIATHGGFVFVANLYEGVVE